MQTMGNTVLTDFRDIYNRFNGLKNSNLVCVAGRTAIGKTTFVLNLIKNVTNEERQTVIFSLDLGKKMILNRIEKSLETLNIYDNILTIDEIENECRRLKAEDNINLVVIDYLQLIKTDKQGLTTKQQFEDINRRLKELTEELNITIIVLSQLSKEVDERENKRPTLGDFKISSSIVEYADTVIFLYRDDYYNRNIKLKNTQEIIVAKDNQ